MYDIATVSVTASPGMNSYSAHRRDLAKVRREECNPTTAGNDTEVRQASNLEPLEG